MKKQTPCGRSREIGAFNGKGRKEEKIEKKPFMSRSAKSSPLAKEFTR